MYRIAAHKLYLFGYSWVNLREGWRVIRIQFA
jgi:hypothetical protein